MIEEQAKVISIDRNVIIVESTVKSTCSSCSQMDSCGSGQIAKAFPQKQLTYTLFNDQPVSIGDMVVIGLSEKLLLSAAWQVYLWPLIGLIIASSMGQWLMLKEIITYELIAVVLGLLGGYLGFFFARKQQMKLLDCPEWTPKLIKIIPANIPVTEIQG